MLSHSVRFSILFVALMSLIGCIGPQGGDPEAKRNDAQKMRSEALAIAYERVPELKQQLIEAPGYGVFSGLSTHFIVLSSGQGFGIIRDNTTRKDTYMRALKLGGGLGVGAEGVRAIVVFHDAKTMNDVINKGWGLTGKAEAAAKAGESGGSGAAVITLPGMSIYRFTGNGVMLSGAIEGVKLWKDEEIN